MNTLMKWLTYKEVVKRKRNHKHNKTAWIKTINRYSPEIALELIEEIYQIEYKNYNFSVKSFIK